MKKRYRNRGNLGIFEGSKNKDACAPIGTNTVFRSELGAVLYCMQAISSAYIMYSIQ
jgi:hypothetical protein